MAIKVAVKIKLMIGLIVRHGYNCQRADQSDNDMIMAVVKIRGLHDVITILDNCHHHRTHYYRHQCHFDHHHHRYHHQDASHR